MSDSRKSAISVKDLYKTFRLPIEQDSGIKQRIINTLSGRREKGYEIQKVLNGINFEIEQGDFFGIVGRNGSGKSTLLKTLAGIYSPDEGVVNVRGSLVPFIELGVGFNPELTGRENVFLNGALLGFSREEMEAMYDDIVEFAELDRFMDQKLKNYSSGMQVRLAFSIAIRANGDILLLDEVLAVGDEAFQRKCYAYFAELKKNKKTVVLVTHSMESVQQFCNKAIMIENGKIVESGNPSKVAQRYSELFLDKASSQKEITSEQPPNRSDDFKVKSKFSKTKDKLKLLFSITPKRDYADPVVGVTINRDNGELVWRWASDDKISANKDVRLVMEADKTVRLSLELDNILPGGGYSITILFRNEDKSVHYAVYNDIIEFDNHTASLYDKFWKMNEKVEII